jgi:NAD(P)-dependent dehydrogenase (short-subunit alcohol dehydrogenase family)
MKKTILITGATAGIGKATATKLARKGHKIILLSRDKQKLLQTKKEIVEETNNNNIDIVQCDLSSQKNIRNTAKRITTKYNSLDILINNAGIHSKEALMSEDGIEKTFAVNHLAYFLLTGLLLKLLKKGVDPRIINVSSNAHGYSKLDFDDIANPKKYKLFPVYGKSKLANVLFTIELAERAKKHGITVNCLHPGFIKTNIGTDNLTLRRRFITILKKYIAETPEKGASRLMYLALSDEVKRATGKYFVNNKVKEVSKKLLNKNQINGLWKLSEKLTNYRYCV